MQVTDHTRRCFAVSALIGECESIAASCDLNESQERALRFLIAETLAAYGLPSKAERLEPFPGNGAYV